MEGIIGMKVFFLYLLLISISFGTQYKTHFPFESDTILTAWLIKTYVDKNATFQSEEKESILDKNISINTPNSPFRRNARFTAYEVAKRHFKVSDTCANHLIKVIKVLEMMPWKKHEFEDILHFEQGLVPLFPKQIGDADLSKVFTYINHYCEGIK